MIQVKAYLFLCTLLWSFLEQLGSVGSLLYNTKATTNGEPRHKAEGVTYMSGILLAIA